MVHPLSCGRKHGWHDSQKWVSFDDEKFSIVSESIPLQKWVSFDDEKFSIVSESIPLPRGLEAAQILTSDAFGLPETRNPALGDKAANQCWA